MASKDNKLKLSLAAKRDIRIAIANNYASGGCSWMSYSREELRTIYGGEHLFPYFIAQYFKGAEHGE